MNWPNKLEHFVAVMPLLPSLMFAAKDRSLPLKGVHAVGLSVVTNITLGWRGLSETITLAYYLLWMWVHRMVDFLTHDITNHVLNNLWLVFYLFIYNSILFCYFLADAQFFLQQPHHSKRSLAPSVLLRRQICSVVLLSVDVDVDVVAVDEDVGSVRPDDGSILWLIPYVFEPRWIWRIICWHERKFKVKLFIYIINRQGHSDPSKQVKDQPLTYDESCGSCGVEILLISANIDLYESQMKRTSDQSDQMTNQSLT